MTGVYYAVGAGGGRDEGGGGVLGLGEGKAEGWIASREKNRTDRPPLCANPWGGPFELGCKSGGEGPEGVLRGV